MVATPCTKTLDLEAGELLRMRDAQGTTVRVNRGLLWLTQHRDTRDIVLGPGDAWMVEQRGLTLVQAQRGSAVTITGPGAVRSTIGHRKHGIAARVRQWVARVAHARLFGGAVPYY